MASQPSSGHPPGGQDSQDSRLTPTKRQRTEDETNGIPSKKIKAPPEEPALYSENVRKKLAATSRTGQACDRCKERKMKCDPDPVACQPCRQKNLRCYTTDRVTGQSRERGSTNRVENEIMYMREQLAAYQQRFGHLHPETAYTPHSALNSPITERQNSQPRVAAPSDTIPQHIQSGTIPSSRYVGWPAPNNIEAIYKGPVCGTNVDALEAGIIDIADFDCELMHDYPIDEFGHFNLSRNSVINTVALRQRIEDPKLPSKEQALTDAQAYVHMMYEFMPLVHKQTFLDQVSRMYDAPNTVSLSERIQVIIVLAIISQQTALRNHSQYAEKTEQSHRYFHYALGFYQDLYRERSLASMQAMTFMLLHFRNLPKPGYTWLFSHTLLIRAMDMEYHRDPDKIQLPPDENNILSKELRKRVFHSILCVCITTGCRVGQPAPWQFSHIDVPLPMAIKDSEISRDGLTSKLSGECDFWPHIQLSKLLPLLTELYNYVISVRRPENEYLKIVEALKTKIEAWRADWDRCVAVEKTAKPFLAVATLLMDTWAAEFSLNLHHPSVCTARSPEIMERNLDACHKAAKKLLSSFHILSHRYKGVDFTWHSTVAYALGFGLTLHVYNRRKSPVTYEQFEAIKNELSGWLSLIAYADLVLRTGNHLQRIFTPLAKALEDSYRAAVTNHPKPIPSSFSHINGSSKSSFKLEENTKSPIEPTPPPVAVTSRPISLTTGSDIYHNSNYSTMSYVAHSNGPNIAYTSYSPSVSQYQALPTSLAPLLNDIPMNGFMNYQYGFGDVPMNFSPGHYTENNAEVMWPRIAKQ